MYMYMLNLQKRKSFNNYPVVRHTDMDAEVNKSLRGISENFQCVCHGTRSRLRGLLKPLGKLSISILIALWLNIIKDRKE